MRSLGTLYTMRQTARIISGTDPRTVFAKVQELGVPYARVGNSIVIDHRGLDRLVAHYGQRRAVPA